MPRGTMLKIDCRKGEIPIFGIILIILAAIIIIAIVGGGIKNTLKSFSLLSEHYKAPKISNVTKYQFSEKNVVPTGCASGAVSNNHAVYDCSMGREVNFAVDVTNNGLNDRRLNPKAVICKYPTADCCNSETKIVAGSKDYCAVAIGKTEICNLDPYTFTESNGFKIITSKEQYEIHPMVECPVDSTFGCYDPGLTESVKSCSNDDYIIVGLVAS